MTRTRARVGVAAIVACYRAHKAAAHDGTADRGCLTCTRYALAVLVTDALVVYAADARP